MTKETEALEPCPNPWCESHTALGGEPSEEDIWVKEGGFYRVECHFCGLHAPHAASEKKAVANWNTRTTGQGGDVGEAVACRWRYRYENGDVSNWTHRKGVLEPQPATPGRAALEVDPLYLRAGQASTADAGERAAIVAWLRENTIDEADPEASELGEWIIEHIEQGAHLNQGGEDASGPKFTCGHPMSPENTMWEGPDRHDPACRACHDSEGGAA